MVENSCTTFMEIFFRNYKLIKTDIVFIMSAIMESYSSIGSLECGLVTCRITNRHNCQ